MNVGYARHTIAVLLCMLFCCIITIASAQTVSVTQNQPTAYSLSGQALTFTGHYSNMDGLASSWLEVNHRAVSSKVLADTSEDDYNYTWSPPGAGEYRIRIGYKATTGTEVYVSQTMVTVLDSSPVSVSSLPETSVSDVTVNVTKSSSSDFDCRTVQLFVNEQEVKEGEPPFSYVLTLKDAQPGKYTLSCNATNTAGETLTCPSQSITVPDRLEFSPPSNIVLSAARQLTPLSVHITPGVAADSVKYICDDEPIGTALSAPFSAKADLSSFPSGPYKIHAELTLDDGTTFDSPSQDVQITNVPDDRRKAAIAQAAEEEAAREAAAHEAADARREQQEYASQTWITQCSDVEVHATFQRQADGSRVYDGTLTNTGNDTLPDVEVYFCETGYSVRPKNSDPNAPAHTDPYLFNNQFVDSYRNLHPGESRSVKWVVDPDLGPSDMPDNMEVVSGPDNEQLVEAVRN